MEYFSERAFLGKREKRRNIFDYLDKLDLLNDAEDESQQQVDNNDDFSKIISQFEEESTRLDSMYENESYFYFPDCKSAFGGKVFDFNEENAKIKQIHNETTNEI